MNTERITYLAGTPNQTVVALLKKLGYNFVDASKSTYTDDNFAEHLKNVNERTKLKLFVFTPAPTNPYWYAELMHCVAKDPTHTIVCLLPEDEEGKKFPEAEKENIYNIGLLAYQNHAQFFVGIEELTTFLHAYQERQIGRSIE